MPTLLIIGIVLLVLVVAGFLVAQRRRRGADLTMAATAADVTTDVSLRQRLEKTRRAMGGRMNTLLGRSDLGDTFWDELEESLIAADMGLAAAARVAAAVKARRPDSGAEARRMLGEELVGLFAGKERALRLDGSPAVILVVGVNGSGKTTTIAKLAAILKDAGNTVILGSADTFRAAADAQLRTWADRVGVLVVGGGASSDPASVAFDAYQAARARDADVLIIDTAGRLQAKTNLMNEIAKVARILRREAGDLDEVLLVVDGTSGQNALSQAKAFTDAVGVTGLVMTKLDGSARGGVAVAVEDELGIPMKFIGVGEALEHLVAFDPDAYVDALVGE